jgi:hypothetical protein
MWAERLMDRALDWVTANLDTFDPNTPGLFPDPHFRFKVFIELVYVWNQLLRVPELAHESRLQQVATHIQQVEATYDVAGMVRAEAAALTSLALMAEFCERRGGSGAVYRTELDRFVAAGFTGGMERLPFRRLDKRYYLDLLSVQGELPDLRALYRRTPAGLHAALPTLTIADMYSITHTIMYLTDMGRRSVEEIVPEDADYLRWLTTTLLGLVVREGELDLMLEFLICAAWLQCPPSVIRDEAWRLAVAHQLPDGLIPPQTRTLRQWQQREVPPSRSEYVGLCYHTTIVGLLAAMAERYPAFQAEMGGVRT